MGGYVRQRFGDNCFFPDSSRKRYWRCHYEKPVQIFNFGCNTGVSGCCNGGGGFWSGFGWGAGMGLANMFMGGLGMLGSWFGGGFGLGGGLGWGGSLDFGSGYDFGDSGNTHTTGRTRRKKRTVSTEPRVVTVEKTDADYKKINDIIIAVKLMEKPDCTNEEAVKVYNAALDKLINDLDNLVDVGLDGVSDDQNTRQIQNAKALLELAKVEYKPLTESDDINNVLDLALNDLNNSGNLENIRLYFDKLTTEQRTKLTDGLTSSLADLKDGDKYKPSEEYETLLQLELLCKLDPSVIVGVEQYNAASDEFIKGPIHHVTKDSNGKVTYWVDCKSSGDSIKAKWKFEVQSPGTVKIVGTVANDSSPKYMARIGMVYKKGPYGYYINNNGKVTATQNGV